MYNVEKNIYFVYIFVNIVMIFILGDCMSQWKKNEVVDGECWVHAEYQLSLRI